MKYVLLQNLIRKNKKEKTSYEPSKEEIEDTVHKVYGYFLLLMFALIIGSIAFGV